MSELRQRRGGGEETEQEKVAVNDDVDPETKKELVGQIEKMLTGLKRNPKPGTSNEAHKVKELLKADPFNMDHIFMLGQCYAQDDQWERSEIVLLRGWKRTSEIEEKHKRFGFLLLLAKASLEVKKYRQALAVVNDMEERDDEIFHVIRCQAYCANGDTQKGLKAFRAAIEGLDFQASAGVWAGCSSFLRLCGIWEATKMIMQELAKTDEDKDYLRSVEALSQIKDSYLEAQQGGQKDNFQRMLLIFFGLIFFAVIIYLLYILEQRSLASLKERK